MDSIRKYPLFFLLVLLAACTREQPQAPLSERVETPKEQVFLPPVTSTEKLPEKILPPPIRPSDPLELKLVKFANIADWQVDDGMGDAFSALQRSCEAILKKRDHDFIGKGKLSAPASEWKPVCREALSRPVVKTAIGHQKAREFFEERFIPYRTGKTEKAAFVTGYYVPSIRASHVKTAQYSTPVYAKPKELKDGVPYLTRKQIEEGALAGKNLEIAWVADPVDLYFLQVQGSGMMFTDSGESKMLAFAAKNQQPYISIGKVLIERGILKRDEVNMPTVKNWLKTHPSEARQIMQDNPSYVFFKKTADSEVKGASGVSLIPERSLAVDPRFIPYGMPIFITTRILMTDGAPAHNFQRLVVAQDTGTAITGALRGDIFFGPGGNAEVLAGNLKDKSDWTLLVPKEVARYAGI